MPAIEAMLSPPTMPSSTSTAPEVAAARALLDRRLRVRLVDGRVMEGVFTCLDCFGNLLLTDASLAADSPGLPPVSPTLPLDSFNRLRVYGVVSIAQRLVATVHAL